MYKAGVGTILMAYLSVTIPFKLHMNNVKTVVSANSYECPVMSRYNYIHEGVI